MSGQIAAVLRRRRKASSAAVAETDEILTEDTVLAIDDETGAPLLTEQ